MLMVDFQVCTRSDYNVQCMRSNIKIHSSRGIPEAEVQKGPYDRSTLSFSSHSSILLHGKVRRSRMDDPPNFLPGINNRLSHSLCCYRSTHWLQGNFISDAVLLLYRSANEFSQ